MLRSFLETKTPTRVAGRGLILTGTAVEAAFPEIEESM